MNHQNEINRDIERSHQLGIALTCFIFPNLVTMLLTAKEQINKSHSKNILFYKSYKNYNRT